MRGQCLASHASVPECYYSIDLAVNQLTTTFHNDELFTLPDSLFNLLEHPEVKQKNRCFRKSSKETVF